METKTVLITDVNAIAGLDCLRALQNRGYRVKALFSDNHPTVSGVEWLEADILDPESYFQALSDVHLILHNATLFSLKNSDQKKLEAFNTIATRDLVNNALLAGVQEMIFISSAYTLIRTAEPNVIYTTAVGNPVFLNHYTKTLFQAELEIFRAAAEGMKICILNCALVKDHALPDQSTFLALVQTLSKFPKLFHQNLPILSSESLAQNILKVLDSELWGEQHLLFSDMLDIQQHQQNVQGLEISTKNSLLNFLSKRLPSPLIMTLNRMFGREDPWFNKAALKMFHTPFSWKQTDKTL